MTNAPMFIHDCTECRLLGTINHPVRGWGDLYECERETTHLLGNSIIFRWSSEGADYTSIPKGLTDGLAPGHVLRIAAALAN